VARSKQNVETSAEVPRAEQAETGVRFKAVSSRPHCSVNVPSTQSPAASSVPG
jgi:hypothetical protein